MEEGISLCSKPNQVKPQVHAGEAEGGLCSGTALQKQRLLSQSNPSTPRESSLDPQPRSAFSTPGPAGPSSKPAPGCPRGQQCGRSANLLPLPGPPRLRLSSAATVLRGRSGSTEDGSQAGNPVNDTRGESARAGSRHSCFHYSNERQRLGARQPFAATEKGVVQPEELGGKLGFQQSMKPRMRHGPAEEAAERPGWRERAPHVPAHVLGLGARPGAVPAPAHLLLDQVLDAVVHLQVLQEMEPLSAPGTRGWACCRH